MTVVFSKHLFVLNYKLNIFGFFFRIFYCEFVVILFFNTKWRETWKHMANSHMGSYFKNIFVFVLCQKLVREQLKN